APLNEFLTYSISNKHCEYAQPRRFPLPRVLKNHCAKQACRNGFHQRTPMLVKPISSSLFILASKRNRVRVGYEKDWFCAGVLFRIFSGVRAKQLLNGTRNSQFLPPQNILMGLILLAYSP